MNFAYLFSGQPIFYQTTLDYFSNYQIDENDKVCSHLWWDKSYHEKVYKLWFTDTFNGENLDKEFIERYGVTDCIVEKHKDFDITFFKKFNFDVWKGESIEHYKVITPIILYGILSQTYSNYQAFLQTKKYQDIDVVIKSRPDVMESVRGYFPHANRVALFITPVDSINPPKPLIFNQFSTNLPASLLLTIRKPEN